MVEMVREVCAQEDEPGARFCSYNSQAFTYLQSSISNRKGSN
jgi:hypothetical protein